MNRSSSEVCLMRVHESFFYPLPESPLFSDAGIDYHNVSQKTYLRDSRQSDARMFVYYIEIGGRMAVWAPRYSPSDDLIDVGCVAQDIAYSLRSDESDVINLAAVNGPPAINVLLREAPPYLRELLFLQCHHPDSEVRHRTRKLAKDVQAKATTFFADQLSSAIMEAA